MPPIVGNATWSVKKTLAESSFSPKGQGSSKLTNMRLTTLTLCLLLLVPLFSYDAIAKPAAGRLEERAKLTSLRNVGLGVFRINSGAVTPAQAALFRVRLANDLTTKSFLNVSTEADSALLDGSINGEIAYGRINALIQSKSGETLAKISIVRRFDLSTPAGMKEASLLVVDEIARVMPYRGFLTKKIEDDVYEMNLGSRQGILKGQRFRAFDLAHSEFGSEKQDLGEIQVTAVADDTSTVEILSGDSVGAFAKIGFAENVRGMVTATHSDTRGYAFVGGTLLSVSAAGDAPTVDRGYNFSTTPGFLVGFGWNRFSFRASLAQAKGTDIDFVFTEVLESFELYEKVRALNRFSIRAGGRVARMTVSTKASFVTPIASSLSLSPSVEARMDRIISGPVRAFAQIDAYYPIFVSGTDTSALISNYGVGLDVGLSLELSRLFIDLGGRYHTYRRPVDGPKAVQENFAEYYIDVGTRF